MSTPQTSSSSRWEPAHLGHRGATVTVAVIIPTLNEASVIERTLQLTRQLGFEEIIVVDGGSTDRTNVVVDDRRPPECRLNTGSASHRSRREVEAIKCRRAVLPTGRLVVSSRRQPPAG